MGGGRAGGSPILPGNRGVINVLLSVSTCFSHEKVLFKIFSHHFTCRSFGVLVLYYSVAKGHKSAMVVLT